MEREIVDEAVLNEALLLDGVSSGTIQDGRFGRGNAAECECEGVVVFRFNSRRI